MEIKFNRKLFEIIVYIFVIVTGICSLVFHLVGTEILSWILITLGVLNLGVTFLRKKKI